MKTGRLDELALHPTVKPVAMIADAIKDVSHRGGVVLDLFGGSGSTMIAAHKTGRRARLCELDPVYCDRILRRWEIFAKDDAELVASGPSRRSTYEEAGTGKVPTTAGPQPDDAAAEGFRTREIESASPFESSGSPRLRRAGSF